MKKIFLGLVLIAFMSTPALASNGGGKKKAKKKAKTECTVDNCDPKNCDPKNCDPKKCDPKCLDLSTCSQEVKCSPTTTSAGNK